MPGAGCQGIEVRKREAVRMYCSSRFLTPNYKEMGTLDPMVPVFQIRTMEEMLPTQVAEPRFHTAQHRVIR